MLEFDKEIVQVKFDGALHDVEVPSNRKIKEYMKNLEESKDADQGDVLIKFLDELGLPENVSMDLNQKQLGKIVSALLGSEKN